MRKIFVLLTALFFLSLFVIPRPASAATFRSGDSLTVKTDEQVNENLFIAGKTVTIDGIVDGDLFCAAETVKITGQVTGDVICAAKTISVAGEVVGNVRLAAQDILITGQVHRNASLLAQSVAVKQSSKILGELNAAGQTVTVDGAVSKNLAAAADEFKLNGFIQGSALLSANTLDFNKLSHVGGGLTYYSDTTSKIPAGIVAGEVKQLQRPVDNHKDRAATPTLADAISRVVGSILGSLLLALAFIYFLPHTVAKITHEMEANPGRTMFWGIVFSIVTPIVIILLIATFIGIATAAVLAGLFVITLIISRVFAAIVVGKMLIAKYSPKHKNDLFWEALIGIIVTWLAFSFPLIGALLSLLAFWWGMGGIFLALRSQRHSA